MKYLRVVSNGTPAEGSYGVLRGAEVSLLSGSPLQQGAEETGERFDIKEVLRFLPPVDPPNIIAIGLNYAMHARETNMEQPAEPVVFLKATTALTGHMAPVVLPAEHPGEVDYEAELVVAIGKKAKNVPEDRALEYVLGYTCGNDVSARDCQLSLDRQWARGKSFDTFAPVGPVIETELDPSNLNIAARVNGRTLQESTTADLIYNVPMLLSYLSRQMTLLPGTVIMTGTPPGVGYGRDPQVFLKAGDVVEVEIEGIGILRNTIVGEG